MLQRSDGKEKGKWGDVSFFPRQCIFIYPPERGISVAFSLSGPFDSLIFYLDFFSTPKICVLFSGRWEVGGGPLLSSLNL